jgi:2-oxoglutarate dehydrogenase E2 component (dihydrolipoamide succinyltransferase)
MSIEDQSSELPESVADATLVAWRKQPGDAVARDENLADLETDKVVLEVPAPAGVLREIKVRRRHGQERQLLAIVEAGATAAVGTRSSGSGAVAAAPAAGALRQARRPPRSGPGGATRGIREQAADLEDRRQRQGRRASPRPMSAPWRSSGGRRGGHGRGARRFARRAARADDAAARPYRRAAGQAQATQALLTTFNEVDLTP